MNTSKNIIIHFSESDVREIIVQYLRDKQGYDATVGDINFCWSRIVSEYDIVKSGRLVYEKTIFKGCDVNVKEDRLVE